MSYKNISIVIQDFAKMQKNNKYSLFFINN